MDTKQLYMAFRLADTLHFGRAAELENIAQSGLSVQIAKLETELGFRIFARSSHRVSMTDAGQAFIDHARYFLSKMDTSILECRAIAEQNRGALKLGFFGDAAGELTHLILTLFRNANPQTKLVLTELSMTNQVQAIISGRVDAALVRMPIFDPRLEIDLMFDEPRMAAVPASHEMAGATILRVTDLVDQPFAVAAEGAPPEWAAYWSLGSETQESVRVAAYVQSIPESLAAVAYGGAFDTFPLAATRMFPHPGVRYVPMADAPRSALALATLAGNRSPGVRSLRRCVTEALENSLSCMAQAWRCIAD